MNTMILKTTKKINPYAKSLKDGKYKQRVVHPKKKDNKRREPVDLSEYYDEKEGLDESDFNRLDGG